VEFSSARIVDQRHKDGGDDIRLRDCVPLGAGGKRNELPYVSKVAQLWDNPDDSESFRNVISESSSWSRF
jgi:hypothetical protein